MKQTAKKFLKHPLVYGSSIVVVGGFLANIFNLLFSLFMYKKLSVPDMGILQSIITLITFPALLANAINPVVVHSAGSYFAKNDLSAVKGLYFKFSQFILSIGLVSFAIFLYFIPTIADFFKIKDHFVLILADSIMLLSFISIINIAFLQARLSFKTTVLLTFISALVKLLFGLLFITVGYSLHGAVGALVISAAVMYLLGIFPLQIGRAHV